MTITTSSAANTLLFSLLLLLACLSPPPQPAPVIMTSSACRTQPSSFDRQTKSLGPFGEREGGRLLWLRHCCRRPRRTRSSAPVSSSSSPCVAVQSSPPHPPSCRHLCRRLCPRHLPREGHPTCRRRLCSSTAPTLDERRSAATAPASAEAAEAATGKAAAPVDVLRRGVHFVETALPMSSLFRRVRGAVVPATVPEQSQGDEDGALPCHLRRTCRHPNPTDVSFSNSLSRPRRNGTSKQRHGSSVIRMLQLLLTDLLLLVATERVAAATTVRVGAFSVGTPPRRICGRQPQGLGRRRHEQSSFIVSAAVVSANQDGGEGGTRESLTPGRTTDRASSGHDDAVDVEVDVVREKDGVALSCTAATTSTSSPSDLDVSPTELQRRARLLRDEADRMRLNMDQARHQQLQRSIDKADVWLNDVLVHHRVNDDTEILNTVPQAQRQLVKGRYSPDQVDQMFERLCTLSHVTGRDSLDRNERLRLLIEATGKVDELEPEHNANKRWGNRRVEHDLHKRLFAKEWGVDLTKTKDDDENEVGIRLDKENDGDDRNWRTRWRRRS